MKHLSKHSNWGLQFSRNCNFYLELSKSKNFNIRWNIRYFTNENFLGLYDSRQLSQIPKIKPCFWWCVSKIFWNCKNNRSQRNVGFSLVVHQSYLKWVIKMQIHILGKLRLNIDGCYLSLHFFIMQGNYFIRNFENGFFCSLFAKSIHVS